MIKAAVEVEFCKLRHSPVGWITTAALLGGCIALLGGISLAIASGNSQLLAKAGEWGTADWHGLVGSAQQIVGASGMIACSVLLAWLYAREFTDRTISGLFALPISRRQLASAKLVVYAGWALLISGTLPIAVLLLGLLLGYGAPAEPAWLDLTRLVALMVGTAVVTLPVAWMATATRSLLAGIGTGIGLVVLSQVGVLSGGGGWIPTAAPSLLALFPGSVAPAQLLLAFAFGAAGALGCLHSWDALQLNR